MTDSHDEPRQATSPEGSLAFEVGPIRPPSEAKSLLVRVSRNCPWNKCTFCPVYKRARFSRRAVEDVLADIDAMGRVRDRLRERSAALGAVGGVAREAVEELMWAEPDHQGIGQVALWLMTGSRTVFLQDANSLLVKPEDLVRILVRLRQVFPEVSRITSYARSHTLSKIPEEGLRALREAGLDRIHVGLESGSDEVLRRVKKGCTKEEHIVGGRKVVAAGMELSEYVMPGLGGAELSDEHADETADALRQIDPHFIRLRTLGLRQGTSLREEFEASGFAPLDEDGVVREIRRLVLGLTGIRSTLASDHILNLLEDVAGTLPEDHERILGLIDGYLGMEDDDRLAFQLGRRLGALRSPEDLEHPGARARLAPLVKEALAHPGGPQALLRELLTRFI
ncbi:MAG: radical SAM protein [Polyangia bacterium]|jgi:hypothetical protein|nr:radical SAM protein [Polyangia bacterium]